jgi:hypothetical protein
MKTYRGVELGPQDRSNSKEKNTDSAISCMGYVWSGFQRNSGIYLQTTRRHIQEDRSDEPEISHGNNFFLLQEPWGMFEKGRYTSLNNKMTTRQGPQEISCIRSRELRTELQTFHGNLESSVSELKIEIGTPYCDWVTTITPQHVMGILTHHKKFSGVCMALTLQSTKTYKVLQTIKSRHYSKLTNGRFWALKRQWHQYVLKSFRDKSSSDADSVSAGQQIPRVLWNPKVY